MLDFFTKSGKASVVLGGQFGSCGKGAAVAFLATSTYEKFDIVTANNGAQSGHTSIHNCVKKVTFHLPTYPLYRKCLTYLNAGAIVDVDVLLRELNENPQVLEHGVAIHPNCAIITADCRDAEMHDGSAQTKIASTRKGVGVALSRKILRSGIIAKDEPRLTQWVRRIDLNAEMLAGKSVLVEVPQGHSLSIDGPFYPHTTSRNCTVGQAMSDAGIHPHFYHRSMLVVRTFPIRVGAVTIDNGTGLDPNERTFSSGGHFPDQHEISWNELSVEPEVTTVTKRVRRIFTFSEQQVAEAIASTRPNVIFCSFMDYLPTKELAKTVVAKLRELSNKYGRRNERVEILTAWGPTTADVTNGDEI